VQTQRQPAGPPPSWLPSERTASLLLVAFLVLFAVALRSNLIPAIEAESTAIVYVTPVTTLVSSTATSTGLGSAAASPTPTTVSAPGSTLPTTALLPDYRIVAYYGHPNTATMGILGQYDKQDLLDQLTEEVGGYERADPDRPVMPAFELIASVAQPDPQEDGSYLLQTDAATIQEYVDFTKANNMILILDIQMGRTSVRDEWKVVEPYMHEPNVHLAIDPEFAMGPDQIPSVDIGSVDADDVNYVQEQLSKIVKDDDLPPKLLIVHRFTDGMLTNSNKLKTVDDIQLVIDADGFGDPPSKQATYELYARDGNVKYAGIKLFYDQDHPLMQPDEVVDLNPAPDFVMYQ
jgi:hypothetical protein